MTGKLSKRTEISGHALRIAFCGTRGLPANYGGLETAVDEISKRFVAQGYRCEAFGRTSHSRGQVHEHDGRQIHNVAGTANERLETVVSSIQTGWYLLHRRGEYDHVFWFNNANLPGIILSLLAGIPTTVNTDGLEWRRRKWTWPFKLYFFFSSIVISVMCPRLISDSRAIEQYYRKTFMKRTLFVPYGIPGAIAVPSRAQEKILNEMELKRGQYFLQITRIEPENNPSEIAQRFRQSGLSGEGFKFVVVGYAHETRYAKTLIAQNDRGGVVVLPANYDPRVLYTLRKNSFCYVHGNSVGGTSPALLEAMALCDRILAMNVFINRDVLGALGHWFTLDNLVRIFQDAVSFPDNGAQLKQYVHSRYQWEAVADSYIAIVENRDATYNPRPISI